MILGEIKKGRKPGILTARSLSTREWINNTTSIYESCSSIRTSWFPICIRKHFANFCRYFNKFDIIIGIRLFIYRKKFYVIISHNCNQAIVFSVLSYISRNKNNLHILEEIYLQKPVRFRQKIRPIIYRIFLRNVDYIRVSSVKEIENYSKLLHFDKNKFWFLPYPSPVLNPRIVTSDEDYILSAGKQYRDYSTLIKAIKGTGIKLIIVSDRNSMKNISTCEEVTVFYNITKEKYLDLLLKSKFVVIPLINDFCSCGQISILEAMSYGKPVIVTKVAGSIDYITDNKSGLFYEKGDFADLRKKIILLRDSKELRISIANEALVAVLKSFNQNVFVEKHFQLIMDVWYRNHNPYCLN